MKAVLVPLALLASAAGSSAATLVGFSSFPDNNGNASDGILSVTAQILATDFSGSVFQSYTNGERLTGGSNDGTYGTGLTGAATNDGYTRISGGTYLDFTITNGTASTYQLSTLFFDSTYTGTPAGVIGIGYRFGTTGGFSSFATGITADTAATDSGTSAHVNYKDNELDVSGITLAAGQSVTFRFSPETGSFRLDNLALAGDVVPEPSAALLGLAGMLPLLRRRRF